MTSHSPTSTAPQLDQRRSPAGGASASQAALALLRELEASLEVTQKALLARDLAGFDEGMREQLRLLRACATGYGGDRTHSPDILANRISSLPLEPPLAAEMRATAFRVLQLGRVQQVLLVRAERSLRMLTNLLAGPASMYSPAPRPSASLPSVVIDQAPNDQGDGSPCRA